MHEVIHHITNDRADSIEVWFELWADALTLQPQAQFRLVARSEYEGDLQVDSFPGRSVVYGWSGCTIQVYRAEQLVREFSVRFPALPPGMTMKDFIALMFGDQPPPAESKAKSNQPKAGSSHAIIFPSPLLSSDPMI